jgi:hypothetical protein
MFHPVIVLRRVLILRRIATSDVSAFEAKPQMQPSVAHGQAFFASIGSVGLAVELLGSDCAEMLAGVHAGIVMQR